MRRLLPSKRDDFFPSLFECGFETDLFDRFFRESHYPKLDHYLSWFHFVDFIKHRNNSANVSKMLVESCLFSTNFTYDKLRLSKFSM